jgi:hypothetical protein
MAPTREDEDEGTAGFKIVAEIPIGDENILWMAGPETKQGIFRVLAGTGGKNAGHKKPAARR